MLEVGGYRHDSVGEDMELICRIHRTKRKKGERYRIFFVPDPVRWTEAPETLKVLSRQRNRWHRGVLGTMLIHRKMLFNPNYGVVGMAAMPYFVLVELLGPVIEFFGYVAMVLLFFLGELNTHIAIPFFIVALFLRGHVLPISNLA